MSTEDIVQSSHLCFDFLKIIYPSGPWTISSIIDNPDPNADNPVIIRGRTFHDRQEGDLQRYLKDRNGQVNLYWQINPLTKDPGNKAHLHVVKSVDRFHVDLDPRKGTHDREAERQLILQLLEDEPRLKSLGLPGGPSLIIDSGNGFWGFWDLVEPLLVEGTTIEDRRASAAELGRYNRWVAEVFNGVFNVNADGSAREIGDTCHNIDRIARLPYTLNIPDHRKLAAGYKPVEASVYARYPERRYRADQFQKSEVISWGAGASQEELSRVEIGNIQKTLPESNDPWEIANELQRQFPVIGQKTLELICMGEYVEEGAGEDNINDKQTPQGLAVNRSRAHWRVNRSLQQYGVPLNIILGILCDARLPISAHAREPIDDRSGKRGARREGRELIRFNEIQIRKCAASIAKQQEAEARADEVLAQERPAQGESKATPDSGERKPNADGPKKKEPETVNDVIRELNERHAVLLQEGGKVRVLSWSRSELEGDNRDVAILQTFEDFRNRYMNRVIQVGTNRNGDPTYKTWAELWLKHPRRRQYLEMRFLPGQPAVVDDYLNLWRGFAIEPVAGDWSLMRGHIFNVLSEGNQEYFDYIINWAAWAVQNPDQQAEVAIVFRGKEGAGKGIFARALQYMFGQHGLHIRSTTHLVGKFNSHLRDCCLLFADEAIAPGRKEEENILKGLITEPEIPIERKGYDVKAAKSHLHIIMASNEDWVVPASIDDRRFAIFNATDDHIQDKPYFSAITDQMRNGGQAAMLHELLNRDLGRWHPRQSIPQTEALKQQKERSLKPEESLIFEVLKDGVIPGEPIPNSDCCVYSNTKGNTNNGIFDQMRIMDPRLRLSSDKTLGAALAKFGCKRIIKYGKRGWWFPPLPNMRQNWEEVMKWDYAWDPLIREWCGQESAPEELSAEMPF